MTRAYRMMWSDPSVYVVIVLSWIAVAYTYVGACQGMYGTALLLGLGNQLPLCTVAWILRRRLREEYRETQHIIEHGL